jgi:glycosyltransferase involved in cell wall biosynthesis
VRHTVLSAAPGEMSARDALDRNIEVEFPSHAPPLTGLPGLPRLFRLSRYLKRFDLVLTYNWGAFDAVMARHLFGGPPLVHHEDGFNEDEALELKTRRNLYRRLGLGAAHRLVVPSERLEAIALKAWAQPHERVVRIANGVPVSRYSTRPAADAIPGLRKRAGEIVVGTVAGLRAVKNLPRLVRAFAAMQARSARLVIVGAGPESERIAAEAGRLGVAMDRPPGCVRALLGQRAIPDLAGRGDGRRAPRRRHRCRRHSPHGVGRQRPAHRPS